ncbi:hypothetical protein [Kosakonia cowanii]
MMHSPSLALVTSGNSTISFPNANIGFDSHLSINASISIDEPLGIIDNTIQKLSSIESTLAKLNTLFRSSRDCDFTPVSTKVSKFNYQDNTSYAFDHLLKNFPETVFKDRLSHVRDWYIESLATFAPSLAIRLYEISRAHDGWDGQDAKAMSFDSFKLFRKFIMRANIFAKDIALYLDYDGNVILSYTDDRYGLVDMTFDSENVAVCYDDADFILTIDSALSFIGIEESKASI